MLLFLTSTLLSAVRLALGASCSCSATSIPIHVDALVPKDPTDMFAGLKSNASSLRRVDATYDIYGVFCQPEGVSSDTVQILVHGITYTSQYWSPPVEEFRNYSYAAFACTRGLPSLAIDSLGVGLSTRPANASDVQFPTASQAVSRLARHLKTTSILPGVRAFKNVVGIGHSAGSATLNFGAISEGRDSPFDALVLTGLLSVAPGALPAVNSLGVPAADVEPLRWAGLDPNYITVTDRSFFYPPNTNSFSPRMLKFDNFTKDVGMTGIFAQAPVTSLGNQFTGPVVEIVGSEDQLFCVGTRCADVPTLIASERVLWPDAKSFDVVVVDGSGHDLNLDFFALKAFDTFVGFVQQFTSGT
ncbi:Alpha/beta hydrolase family-domain-containing protein [Roridomyces roridus]|uniref:Alpha/beta hydrolase family-domain-containing protein n=1 Tax=Roridomyces roridus TaxID=1738132 RepID=A0AAD7B5E6_9AGAR|nr:Alpha/beta hydrolase family-domain-containing protein [Roridomyces roridus]